MRRTLFIPGRQIDDQFLTEMEEKLIRSDFGVRNAEQCVTAIRDRWRLGKIRNAEEAGRVMQGEVLSILTKDDKPDTRELRFAAGPTVILVAGINGAGKTTSIAKLAWLLKEQMKKKVADQNSARAQDDTALTSAENAVARAKLDVATNDGISPM